MDGDKKSYRLSSHAESFYFTVTCRLAIDDQPAILLSGEVIDMGFSGRHALILPLAKMIATASLISHPQAMLSSVRRPNGSFYEFRDIISGGDSMCAVAASSGNDRPR